ncbi:MAG: hypothetical protein ACRCUM_02380 [Mycoplasmoidaceae bacterium]
MTKKEIYDMMYDMLCDIIDEVDNYSFIDIFDRTKEFEYNDEQFIMMITFEKKEKDNE